MFFSKKAQMIHMAGPADIIIILVGVLIGVVVTWYGISQGWPVISGFCPSVAVP